MLSIFVGSLIITGVIIFISKKTGFVNQPNPIVETHKVPVPYGGGIAIGLTIIIMMLNFDPPAEAYKLFLLIVPVLIAGVIDDSFKLSPLNKLICEIVSILPFTIINFNLSVIYIFLTLLTILILQNAWNLIDVMDGLTSGISVIIFLSTGIIVLLNRGPGIYSLLSFVTAISILGFRWWNKYPARIFLGDTGSLLLGTLFGFILTGIFIKDELTSGFILLLGGIPLFEMFFLIIVRTKKGIAFYKGSPDHFALRLLNRGITVKEINNKVLLISIIHSLIVILLSISGRQDISLIIGFLLSLSGAIYAFNYFNRIPAKLINS